MIRIGVIGYGYWGPFICRNINSIEGLHLQTIADRRVEARVKASASCPGVLVTDDPQQLIDDPVIDAVAIITPVSTHYELARRALLAGKHIFVEKPFTLDSHQAEDLIELAEQRHLQIMVDHTFLFTGAVTKIKELLTGDSQFGRIYYYDSVRINLGLFQHDVNVVWDLAPHDLSIMDHLLQRKPQALCAHGACHFGRPLEDVAYLILYFEDNLIAHFHLNWLSPSKIRRTIIGCERKMLLWDDMDPENKIRVYDKGVDVQDKEGVYEMLYSYRWGDMWAPRIANVEALHQELSHFRDCLDRGEKPLNDGNTGLRVVRLLEASSRSLAEGGRIVEIG